MDPAVKRMLERQTVLQEKERIARQKALEEEKLEKEEKQKKLAELKLEEKEKERKATVLGFQTVDDTTKSITSFSFHLF